jgi:hypothetical protein
MSTLYPGGDYPVTPNLGLALWDMSFEMAENMILIDTAVGSGSSVQINGSVIANPNFNNTTPAAPAGKSNVLWQVSGSSVSAYVDSVSVKINGATTSNPNFNNTTPSAPGGSTNVIWQVDGTGNVSAYFTAPAAPVTSVFTRTGAVTAQTGDYTPAQVGAVSASIMSTLGDMLYENATPTATRLAGNTTSTKMYLSQTGTGSASAAPVWAQINYADITGTVPTPPSGSVLWSDLGAAGADLTLANAGFNTTFNQTSAVNWKWANTTAATSGVSQSSPILNINGKYWDGAASQTDSWTLQDVIANGTNGTSTLTFTHSGTTGISLLSAPLFQAGVGSTSVASYSFAGHPTWGLWAAGGLTPTFTGGGTGGQGLGVSTTAVLVGVQGGWFNLSVPSIQTPTQATPISIKPNLAFGYGTGDAGAIIDIGFSRTNANNLAFGTTGVIGDTSGSLSFTNIVGSVIHTQIATPAAPTIAANFGSGASTWGYKVVAKDSFGSSIGSAEGTVSNNATLSNATAGNKITVTPVAGAKTYDIYRTTVGTSPATTGKIATLTLTSAVSTNNYIAYDVGALTISAVANASGGNTVYTASMTNYASQTMIGSIFVIAGFVNGANNGTFTCVAQTGSSLTLNNPSGIAETHAATATQTGDSATVPATNTTGTLKLTAGLMDSAASLGSSGQVLSSTGTATQWIAQSSVASNAVQIQGVSVTTNTPQNGDALRYNLNGDNKWDVGGWLRPFIFGRADGHNIALANIGTGFTTYQITTSAGPTVNLASATEPNSLTINTGVTGTTTGRGVGEGNTNWSFGTFYRVSIRCQLQQTTNVRYWIGAGINIGSANATYSTDTPNTSYIAFRYSAGTDATIKAVCGTATASQTVVNTGVSVDTTASHVFEVTYDGTNVNFYIDGALKAQISTTLPATTALINSGVVVDNQNTANDQNFKICWLGVTVK